MGRAKLNIKKKLSYRTTEKSPNKKKGMMSCFHERVKRIMSIRDKNVLCINGTPKRCTIIISQTKAQNVKAVKSNGINIIKLLFLSLNILNL